MPNRGALVRGLTPREVREIYALRGSRRDELVALTQRHLQPVPEAYIKDYEKRSGKTDLTPAQ